MNRYSNYTPSAYSPMSFQEIAMVPMMKRQQHDANQAKLDAYLNEINKIDPLDVHTPEAIEIKTDLANKINFQAEKLANEGFNNNTVTNVLKTNREIQDLFSPTGRAGQINRAKQLYDTEKARFLEAASKQYGSTRALELWDKHKNSYTGYEDPEKTKIKYIDSKGIVAAQNFDDDLKTYHSLLGETQTSASNSGYKIVDSGLGDGSKVMVNSSGQTVKSNNIDQLNKQRALLNAKWLTETGEGYKFNTESGINLDNFKNRFNDAIDMQQKSSVLNKTDISGSYIGGNITTKDDSSIFGEDYHTTEIGGENEESYSEIKQIGVGSRSKDGKIKYGEDGYIIPQTFKVEDIKDVKQKALYEQKWKEATTDGIIVDGKKMKLTKEAVAKGKNDRKNAEFIIKSLTQNPITLTSRLLTTNQVLNSKGFVAGLGDNADDIDKNIRRQLERDDESGRKLIDPKTGKVISWNDAVDEYNLDDIQNVHYQGFISPHNWENTSYLGTNSKFSPHVVTVKDEDGKWISFQTTRLSSDNLGGNIQRQNELQDNFRAATVAHNSFVPFKSKSPNFKDIEIKYNPSEDEYDEKTGEPKSWTIKFKGKGEFKTTESKYMNWVNSIK